MSGPAARPLLVDLSRGCGARHSRSPDRLSRDGLVTSERQPQPAKPDRLVYELTDTGRGELQHWLAEPAERTRGHRDDFFLKLLAAAHVGDPAALTAVLSRQRAYLLGQLRAVTQDRHEPGADPIAVLVATAAELHLHADLALLDVADQQTAATTRSIAVADSASTAHHAAAGLRRRRALRKQAIRGMTARHRHHQPLTSWPGGRARLLVPT